jgi:hypothetical protein
MKIMLREPGRLVADKLQLPQSPRRATLATKVATTSQSNLRRLRRRSGWLCCSTLAHFLNTRQWRHSIFDVLHKLSSARLHPPLD